MESINTDLALDAIENECARTDNVIFPISEICYATVSLSKTTKSNIYKVESRARQTIISCKYRDSPIQCNIALVYVENVHSSK